MTAKLEAVQAALKSYFDKFPRISIKGLSARTGVPYATLRRLMQNEVSEIRDDTIFKLIDRVMARGERLDFLCEHYPALARILRAEEISTLGPRHQARIHLNEQGVQALFFTLRDFEKRLRDLAENFPGPIAFSCDYGLAPQVPSEILRPPLGEASEITS